MLDAQTDPITRLADLVASRLCHDLVNPLGAIGNGVELLEMTGKADGPEMDLIRDAVASAQARIRLFRLAFGGAGPDQVTSRREAAQAVEGYFHQSRIAANWQIDTDRPRQETKLAFLMLLCAEIVLPMGGEIDVAVDENGHWSVEARGARLNVNEEVWGLLRFGEPPADADLRPSDTQFPVLIYAAAALGLTLNYVVMEEAVRLTAT